jgi:phosphatidylglycerol:prolipoprotein diacylglycerol transferase
MLPELFHFNLGGHEIHLYTYGLMMIVGFFAAVYLARFLANKSGLDGELFVNAGLIGLISGVIGARASHVLENLDEFTRSDRTAMQNFLAMINLSSGGLTYYGGFILAFIVLIWYARKKKVSIPLGMDIIAPCLMIGLGFGRIGCFLNGCCHGAVCDEPYAVTFPYYSNPYIDQYDHGKGPLKDKVPQQLVEQIYGQPRLISPAEAQAQGKTELLALMKQQRSLPVHAAQLYSTITCFILAALLVAYFSMPHVAGRVFALMLMLEGLTRFLLEMLRVEPPVIGSFSLSMVLGLMLVGMGAILWITFGRFPRIVAPSAQPATA